MLKGVLPANDWGRRISGAGHNELIVGADASVGVRDGVEQSARCCFHAWLSDVESVEVKPQLTDVCICLKFEARKYVQIVKL